MLSWMAVDASVPEEQTGWIHYGNVSTFQVSETGVFSPVDHVDFDDRCEAVYGMTTNSDGSIIAVLCKGYPEAELLPGAIDLLNTVRSADCDPENIRDCYPIGHYCPTGSSLYIFEYTGGQVTRTPDRIIHVNHAVGGWNYGHHEIALNEAEDTYFLAVKVTNNRCDHEGLKHFGVRRTPDVEYVRLTDEWACSGGHTLANRLAYNGAHDYWSMLCTNDLCNDNGQFPSGRCLGVKWTTVPGTSYQGVDGAPGYHEGEELLAFEAPQSSWNLPGGSAALVSLGNDGWLGLALGPDGSAADEIRLNEARSMGLIRLPVDGSTFAEGNGDDWQWLLVPNAGSGEAPRFGSANLAYFDTAGEDSERLLLGWSPSIEFQGLTSEYVVSEVDRQGRLRGEPLVLDAAGWGENNRWATMPSSGCVVFAFAWTGDGGPGQNYTTEGEDATAYPTIMHLTSLCPDTSEQPALTEPTGKAPTPAFNPSGSGCNCDTDPARPDRGILWLVLALLTWVLIRRRAILVRHTRAGR
jgi:MYXO-CTERM domain-containing protein